MSEAPPSVIHVRILHTSDWHLGRTFHGHSTLDAAAEVLGRLPSLVREHEIDVVVVAGDVFDTSVPSGAALAVFERVLIELRDAGATVIVTSGNHDSPARLGFQSSWAERAGVHVRTDPDRLDDPVFVHDEHGPVAFFPIPYLEPAMQRHRAGAAPMSSQADAAAWAVSRIRAAAAGHDARAVVIAHLFAAGVAPAAPTTDVERDITAGGIDVVPLEVFAGFDLVLLGHIHGRAELDARTRYCGAPVHYSFSEANKPRGAWLIELGAPAARGETGDGNAEVTATWLELPIPRPLTEIRGRLDELLADPALEAVRDHWVKAVLIDTVRPLDPMRKLQARFPWCAVLDFVPDGRIESAEATYGDRVRAARTDIELIDGFLEHVRGAALDDLERGVVVDVLAEIDGGRA